MNIWAILVSAFLFNTSFASANASVIGNDVLSGQKVNASANGKKGLVVVFLSAVCPCSNSHIEELKALSKEYTDFAFVGIHSNTDEQKIPTQEYFKNTNLPFPVIQDNGAKIADEFKANKTPHAFVIKSNGEVAYRGGISNSQILQNADRKYLKEALEDLSKSRTVSTPEGRTLGCYITRGEKNVW